MNHAELQADVEKLLSYTGWEWLHVRKSVGRGKKYTTTTNIKGWPDLAPIWSRRQPGRFLAIEIKVPPDKLKPDQETVRERLLAAGFEYRVVTPADLESLPGWLRRPAEPSAKR